MVGSSGKSRTRLVLATLGVVGALVFGGCDWTMFGYDAAHTGSSPDTAINSGNASALQPLFSAGQSAQFGSPVESNGVVYAVGPNNGGQNYLEAFDANGVSGCSGTPNQCSPLWTGAVGGSTLGAPAVANGVVYVTTTPSGPSPGGALYAFDANGVTNCSGTPKVCQPLWTGAPDGSNYDDTSPTVANGVVYVGNELIAAFDANGVTDCSGTPKVCQPIWTSSNSLSAGAFTSPAVANGVLYTTGEDDKLYAFDANGVTNCSGTPTTCNPLWTATMGTSQSFTSPTVANGVVYAESSDDKLFAFDANGVTNCSGTPTACSPLWTAALAGTPLNDSLASMAVANGIVFATSTGFPALQAFDANGVTNCSGSPKTCTPLWSYNDADGYSSPSVANGLVFMDSLAFDANGVTNCSGTPKVCDALWTGSTIGVVVGAAAIANGKVYVTDNTFNGLYSGTHLYAWVLPPPNTEIVLPKNNAKISGTEVLSAGSSPGVTSLQFEISGGPSNLHDQDIGTTADPTIYGWLSSWDTTTVPNGTYTLQSVASYGGEVSGTSAPITITVHN